MAATGYTGVPEVQPEARAPNAYQDIRADASSFGADIGKGLQEAGAQASKTGQMFAQVAADDASNQLTERWTKRLYGDPNATVPGPDGKPMADTGYMGLKGRAALDARPKLKEEMDADLKEIQGGLTTLEMQKSFENFSRRYRSHVVERVGSHAEGQANVWYGHVNQASEKLALEHISIHADDPEEVKHGTSDLLAARVKQAQLAGGGDELLTQARKSAQADALKARVEAIAVKDPVRALDLLEQNREIAGTSYVPLASHLRARADQVTGRDIADEELGRKVPGRSGAVMDAFQNAGYSKEAAAAVAGHFFHESSNNPNAVHDNGTGLGIAGWRLERLDALKAFAAARGSSANNFDTQVQFAIHELEHGDAGAQRAGAELKNAKTVDDAVAAFMHFERPRGYTPDNPRNGDSYNARLANAYRAFGGDFSGLPDKTTAFERVVSRTDGDVGKQNAALSWMNHVYTIYNTEARQASAAFKTQVQDSMAEAMRTGSVQQPLTQVDFVNNFGVGDGPRAFGEYQAQVKLGADMASVATMLPEEQDELLKRYEPKPGEGYTSAAKRQDALAKVIEQVRAARVKDPDFKARIDASVNEAARTGHAANPVSIAEFQGRLGADAGTAAYNQYRASLRLGRDAQTVTDLSTDEQNALLRSYEPEGADDLGGQAKRQQELRKAVEAVRKERDADPAAYALTRLPAVRAAQVAMGQTISNQASTPEQRTAATRQYVNVTLAEQARVGVAPEDRTILTKDQADKLSMDLMKPMSGSREGETAVDIAGNIEAQARLWGENWPLVYKQVQKDAVPAVRVIGSGVAPFAARVLTELAPKGLPEILKDQDTEKSAAIKKDVLEAFKPFAATMLGSENRLDIFNDFRGQAEKLAAYYVVGGKTSSEAAEQAFKDLLGFKYSFVGTSGLIGTNWTAGDRYRVPKDIPEKLEEIQSGAQVLKGRLKPDDFAAPRDTVGGLRPEYLANVKPTAYARDAFWVTAPGDAGLMLVYNDEAVRGKDGQPFIRSWKDIAAAARGMRDELAARTTEQRALAP